MHARIGDYAEIYSCAAACNREDGFRLFIYGKGSKAGSCWAEFKMGACGGVWAGGRSVLVRGRSVLVRRVGGTSCGVRASDSALTHPRAEPSSPLEGFQVDEYFLGSCRTRNWRKLDCARGAPIMLETANATPAERVITTTSASSALTAWTAGSAWPCRPLRRRPRRRRRCDLPRWSACGSMRLCLQTLPAPLTSS